MRRIALLACAASVAAADPVARVDLGGGMAIAIANGKAVYRKAKRSAALGRAQTLNDPAIDKKRRQVEVTLADSEGRCGKRMTWTFANLDARLEEAAANAARAKKDAKAAADGYALAIKADPAWSDPAFELAGVRVAGSDVAGALQAIAPWLTSDPVGTYVHVATDATLAPLLARDELKAVRAAKPGSVKVEGKSGNRILGVNADRGLIAVTLQDGQMSCNFAIEVEVREIATNKLVASAPLVMGAESVDCDVAKKAKPVVAARAKALETLLNDLGFAAVTAEVAANVNRADTVKWTGSFVKAKLGVVVSNSSAHVLTRTTELGTVATGERMRDASLVPDQLAVVWTFDPAPEDCDGDPTRADVMTIKAPRK